MAKTVVELIDICKTYDTGAAAFEALHKINLVIEEGEFLAIIGPSGSGKSTLMHILGCLDTPTSGKMLLEGKDISRMSANELSTVRNKRIGFVFQTFNLLPRFNILQNVELPMVYGGVSPFDRKKRAMDILKMVGLDDRWNHLPQELSGGQRQRAAIARALIMNPAMVFADEPTGNLDTKTGAQIMELFKELNKAGHTIILVTHDKDIAAQTKRQIEIRDGRILGA
ncbi:ABC transporter ATP-binding protein [bacterium]|nr:ABC transporter ATP-binding protein [bacterium]MBR6462144.1 ABC transporter ATP-binding protein [bacterium]